MTKTTKNVEPCHDYNVYMSIIDDVASNVEDHFVEEEVELSVVQELKEIWKKNLIMAKAIEALRINTLSGKPKTVHSKHSAMESVNSAQQVASLMNIRINRPQTTASNPIKELLAQKNLAQMAFNSYGTNQRQTSLNPLGNLNSVRTTPRLPYHPGLQFGHCKFETPLPPLSGSQMSLPRQLVRPAFPREVQPLNASTVSSLMNVRLPAPNVLANLIALKELQNNGNTGIFYRPATNAQLASARPVQNHAQQQPRALHSGVQTSCEAKSMPKKQPTPASSITNLLNLRFDAPKGPRPSIPQVDGPLDCEYTSDDEEDEKVEEREIIEQDFGRQFGLSKFETPLPALSGSQMSLQRQLVRPASDVVQTSCEAKSMPNKQPTLASSIAKPLNLRFDAPKRPRPSIPQVDGPPDCEYMSDDEDEGDEEDEEHEIIEQVSAEPEDEEEEEDPEAEETSDGDSEHPIDDIDAPMPDDIERMFQCDNQLTCSFEKITKSKANCRFNASLKWGILSVDGKEFILRSISSRIDLEKCHASDFHRDEHFNE